MPGIPNANAKNSKRAHKANAGHLCNCAPIHCATRKTTLLLAFDPVRQPGQGKR